jgi:hypothetical protein
VNVQRMKQRLKVAAFTTAVFAACGFLICWILLAYSAFAHAHHQMPDMKLFMTLCPPSIISLGLDNASVPVALLGWAMIGLLNALTYSVPGLLVGLLVALVGPKSLLILPKG